MKQFLSKISLFFLILSSLFIFNIIINYSIFNLAECPIKAQNILIAGDSHPQRALDPSQFLSSANIALSAEPYILTYWKLGYLFQHIKPRILLLGFGHHNISAFNDFKFWDKNWSTEMFRRSYIIQNFDVFMGIKGIKIDFAEFLRVYFREMCLYPYFDHFSFIGGYAYSDKSDLSDSYLDATIKRHFYYNGKESKPSETAIRYLDNIINLCKLNGVIPVLIGFPVHQKYFNKIPQDIKLRYDLEKEIMRKKGVFLFDFAGELYEDAFFLNSDHLNAKSTGRFAHEVKQQLKQIGLE